MNALLRRRMMMTAMEGEEEMIKPFYSDYPELTENGIYVLTPQTEETTQTNLFVQIGDAAYAWAGSASMNSSYTIVMHDTVSRVFLGNILNASATLQRTSASVEGEKNSIKLKRCSGSEASEALVTFYVEQIF